MLELAKGPNAWAEFAVVVSEAVCCAFRRACRAHFRARVLMVELYRLDALYRRVVYDDMRAEDVYELFIVLGMVFESSRAYQRAVGLRDKLFPLI